MLQNELKCDFQSKTIKCYQCLIRISVAIWENRIFLIVNKIILNLLRNEMRFFFISLSLSLFPHSFRSRSLLFSFRISIWILLKLNAISILICAIPPICPLLLTLLILQSLNSMWITKLGHEKYMKQKIGLQRQSERKKKLCNFAPLFHI